MFCTQNLPQTQKFPDIDEDFFQHTYLQHNRVKVKSYKMQRVWKLQGITKQITILYIH